MNRNELIEKAQDFLTTPVRGAKAGTLATWMADFALSLEAKDEWPQEGDTVYIRHTSGGIGVVSYDEHLHKFCLERGAIHRTEAEADLADRQCIARTAIHRWIEEKAEKVDDYRFAFSPQLFDDEWRMVELQYRIPGWFFVKTTQDYDRMMSENAQHFEVLKEGM